MSAKKSTPSKIRITLPVGDAFRKAFGTAGPMHHCSHCRTARSTYAGKFTVHNDPAGQPCPNSGQPFRRPDPLPPVQPEVRSD